MTPRLREAIRAAQDRKALNMTLLDVEGSCSFTSVFLICSGTSTRHTQAICDAIVERLKKAGNPPSHVEGYSKAEWILVDCLDFIIHIFAERAREFYDLERLWKNAPRLSVEEA